MSPETLTHIVYVILVVSFVLVMTFMVVYNLRAKAREKSLQPRGKHHGRTARGQTGTAPPALAAGTGAAV